MATHSLTWWWPCKLICIKSLEFNKFSRLCICVRQSCVGECPRYNAFVHFQDISRSPYRRRCRRLYCTSLNILCKYNLYSIRVTPRNLFLNYSLAFTVGLIHWSWVTHICVVKLTIIGSDNGLSPGRCQAIIWANAGLLLIGPSETNFSKISIEIHTFSSKKMHFKKASANGVHFIAASMC